MFFHFDTVIVMSSPAALMFVIPMPEDELSFHLLDGVLLLLNVLLFPEKNKCVVRPRDPPESKSELLASSRSSNFVEPF